MHYDDDLDARGLLCPLPVLKLRKRLQVVAKGAVLRLQADDPAAVVDVPHFCIESGNVFLGCTDAEGAQHYFVRKAG